MFANLEISSAGLVKATVRPRFRRTNTGCSECRRRKKKCDEQRPVCGNCLRYTKSTGLKCTWSTGKQSASQSSPPQSGSSSKDDSSRVKLLNDAANTSSHGAKSTALDSDLSPQSQTELLPSSLSGSFNSQPEQQALQFLDAHFRDLTTPVGVKLHMFDHTIALAATRPVVKNAYVAAAQTFMAMKDSTAERKLISAEYYSKTIKIIRKDLIDAPGEDLLSAVLLVNFTEEMQSATPNPAHIHGVLALQQKVFPGGVPATVHQHLLLESCIFTIVMATRPPFTTAVYASLPDGSISSLLKVLEKSSQQLWPGPLWKTSALIGISQDLFDTGFRLAQLRRRLPLEPRDQLKLARLGVRLRSWRLPEVDVPPLGLQLTAALYHLACSLFFHKLSRPSLRADHPIVRAIMQKVVLVIAQIPISQLAAPVMAWPILILAFGAWTDPEKKALRNPFEYQKTFYGMQNAALALGLMEFIWSLDGSNGGLHTLEGLISDEYLSLIPP